MKKHPKKLTRYQSARLLLKSLTPRQRRRVLLEFSEVLYVIGLDPDLVTIDPADLATFDLNLPTLDLDPEDLTFSEG